MNNLVGWLLLCSLFMLGWSGTVLGDTTATSTKITGRSCPLLKPRENVRSRIIGKVPGLKSTILKPEVKILPPFIEKDSRQAIIESALDSQFARASWILDEPLVAGNRIVHVFDREAAYLGQRVAIQARDGLKLGDRLTVHRPGKVLHNPDNGQIMGRLSETLGIVEIVELHAMEWTAVVVQAYKEIVAGDLVDLFLNEKTPIQFKDDPDFAASGPIIHIENDLEMAGLGQVVVVGLGMRDQVYPGLILPVFRSSVDRALHESGKTPRLDSLPLGEVAFFRIAANASLALVTESKDVAETGDWIGAMVASPKYRENP
ncbi:MAG: hypothetical protein HQL81_09225 [Magnetococcales bacterium]|nr:hypothetical protein [Magnetococcales bacterium]